MLESIAIPNHWKLKIRLVYVFKNWKLLFENICRNTCGWKKMWKYVKYCLKTENNCLKTQTKHPLIGHLIQVSWFWGFEKGDFGLTLNFGVGDFWTHSKVWHGSIYSFVNYIPWNCSVTSIMLHLVDSLSFPVISQ